MEGLPQKQLSKEFVRQWLIANGFQGKEGQKVPVMPDKFVNEISDRYIELYEKITGDVFLKSTFDDLEESIEKAILKNI
jgi:phosphoribosylaminoimidazole-succinocarboxamide synthase